MARRQRAAIGIGVGAAAALGAAPAAQAAIIEVENLDDSGADSLRDAITEANTTVAPDQIVFDSSLSGAIFLNGTLPVISQPLDINGPGADEIVVDAYYASPANARIFELDMTTPGEPARIGGLTMQYGFSPDPGGAIFNYDSELTVDGSTLLLNISSAGDGVTDTVAGGAVAVTDEPGADLLVQDSAIVFNGAPDGHGGGIGAVEEFAGVVNSTIAENDAGLDGGGVHAQGTSIENSTIAGNVSEDGGGIAAPVAGGATVSIRNSIVADNTATDLGPDLSGDDPFTVQFSLIEDTTDATVPPLASNLTGVDPGLDNLDLNGGTTPTALPAYDSPVIDQGMTVGGVTTDQRGGLRPVDIPAIVDSAEPGADGADMGAVELTVDETTPADLELDLDDSPNTVFVGDTLTYTADVTNNGPEPATGVDLEVVLPDLVSFNAAASSAGCTASPIPFGAEVDCTIPSVLSGATQTRTIAVTPLTAAGANGYTYAYGEVRGDQVDPNSYDNTDFEETEVRRRPTTSTTTPPPAVVPFDLKAAIKKCKKKFRGKRRANCIKKARKKAAASAQASPSAVVRHPFALKPRPSVLRDPAFRAYRRTNRLP